MSVTHPFAGARQLAQAAVGNGADDDQQHERQREAGRDFFPESPVVDHELLSLIVCTMDAKWMTGRSAPAARTDPRACPAAAPPPAPCSSPPAREACGTCTCSSKASKANPTRCATPAKTI